MRCCPFQYFMSPMLCNVVMMSSGLIAVIILYVARATLCVCVRERARERERESESMQFG